MSQSTVSVASLIEEARRCYQARRLGDAERLYREILSIDDRHAESWQGLGAIALECGRPDTAVKLIGNAISIQNDVPLFHSSLATALERQGRLAEAAASLQRAISLQPDDAEIHASLGTVFGRLRRLDAAVDCFERALALNPGNVAAQFNLGLALEGLGKLDAALASYGRARALRPDSPETLNSLGTVLFALKRVGDALEVLERAVTLRPGYADAWNNRGTALLQLHRLEEALASYERALALNPAHATARFNRGNTLVHLKRLNEALADFARAQAMAPDFPAPHWGESLCRLLAGDFPGGWEKYKWRWRVKPELARSFASPLWEGDADLAGKTILLYAEQGFGDTIQFCRYVSLVAARGARVLFEAPPVLMRLMATLDGGADLHAQGAPLPPADYHCPLLTLPFAFKTSLETIPVRVPYLAAEQNATARWRERLREMPRPLIGLVWSGRLERLTEEHRSIAPDMLAPLLACDATFVSLQKEYRPEDRPWLAAHPQVLDFSAEIADFADTAALASAMDLTITIDTAVAHLAGALGLPVWILLSYIGDWRWMLDRADSPWYPTARLYRQTTINDWTSVIARVAEDLRNRRGDIPGQAG